MNSKNIVVLCGNPDADTFSGAVLDHYQAAAEDAGHVVRRYNIGEMDFDPILHKGYKEIQALEPMINDKVIYWSKIMLTVNPIWSFTK